MAGDRAGALATLDHDNVIGRIAQGEYAANIAKELGVHHSSIYRQLAKHPEYEQAKEEAWHFRLDDALQEIEKAPDPCTLARARERFRAIAWRAERECPGKWGQKTQITGDLTVNVTIARGVTLDGDIQDVVAEDDVQPQQIRP
jgi:IS30 family transposase